MKKHPLSQIRSRLIASLALRNLLLLPYGLAGVALIMVLTDAALDLSEETRAATAWLLGVCAVIAIILTFLQLRRLTPKRIACLYEWDNPALGNRLTNAVELQKQETSSAVHEFLRLEAIELGRKTASTLKVWPVLRRASRLFVPPMLLCGLGYILVGLLGRDILMAVLPRFLDPHGDNPPYSRLQIKVSPEQAQVLYGGTVEVQATAAGRPVDKLWLVAKTGTNLTRTIMFRSQDHGFFQTLANLREPAEYFVTDGKARSRRFPIHIRYTPQITLVEVTTQFPDYTGKAPHKGKLSDEVQSLPADTKITFRVASNRPLKAGELTLTPVLGGKPIQANLQPEAQDSIVSGSFVLTEPVVFSLSVLDVDGLRCTDSKQGRFNILRDEKPHLFVLEPGRDAVATPTIPVPVRVQAEDDYGVTRVVWLRGHNRSIDQPFNMKLALKNGPRAVESAGSFDLAKLGVRPGDVIEYYFEAADNYPKGPNVTLSRLYRLEIISKEQFDAIQRQNAARQALFEPYFATDAWLKRLAERARALDEKAKKASESDKQALAEEAAALEKDLEKYQEALGKLMQTATMFDVEESFRKTLVEQHTQIGQALEGLKKGGAKSEQLQQLSKKLDELAKKNEEEVQEPAQQLASVANLISRADVFARLSREQAAVVRLLDRFKEKSEGLTRTEQMEVQELNHQQNRIKTELRDLLSSLPELMGKIPEDAGYDPLRKQVTDFMAAVAAETIEPDIDQASTSLSNADVETGFFFANSAAVKMDKLVSKCNGMPEQGKQGLCQNFKPSVNLGNSLEQILSAMGGNKPGNGQGGQDGYSMFNNDVGIYGPNATRPAQAARGEGVGSGNGSRHVERVANEAFDPGLKNPEVSGRVRLQPGAKFPLRYRDLVGEYFRAIAESELEEK